MAEETKQKRVGKGGRKLSTICKRGHVRTDENTYLNDNGHAVCRECRQMRNNRSYAKDPTKFKARGRKSYLKHKERYQKFYQANKEEIIKRTTLYRINNPEKVKDNALKNKYGISLSEFDEMQKEQGNVCAICKDEEYDKVLCVDHSHVTGKIRGLLCHKCNSGLGFLKDDPEVVLNALNYLLQAQEQ